MIFLSVFLCSMLIFLGCTGCTDTDANSSPAQSFLEPSNQTNSADSKMVDTVKYNPTDQISIEYPRFSEPNYKEVNRIIKQYAEDILLKQDVTALQDYSIQLNYCIKHLDQKFLSVIFQGSWNYIKAAHPIDYFDSLTIDIQNNKVVQLNDLYCIDKNFVQMVRKEFKEQTPKVLSEKLDVPISELNVEDTLDRMDDLLLQKLLQESYSFFLTDKAMGISIDVAHAIGDHTEIYIDYSDIAENAN